MISGVLVNYREYADCQGDQRDTPDTHQVLVSISSHCNDFTIFYLYVAGIVFGRFIDYRSSHIPDLKFLEAQKLPGGWPPYIGAV